MRTADDNTDALIGLIGSLVFAICILVIPFLKITGLGFVTQPEESGRTVDIFLDGTTVSQTGESTLHIPFSDYASSNIQIIWDIAALWMFVFLGLGLIGFLLVLLPSAQKLISMEPINFAFYGFLAGFIGTMVHYLLIVLGVFLAGVFGGAGFGFWTLNLITLALMIVGWVALYFGYQKAAS